MSWRGVTLDFQRLARSVEDGSHAPLVLHARRVDAYELDFQALEFVVEEPLPAVDRAVLGLAEALGRIGSEDLRCYLGLGHVVAGLMLQRLEREGLLEEGEGLARLPTRARPIEPLSSGAVPSHVLTEMGQEALAGDVRRLSRVRPCRLILWEDPLHFVGVARDPERTKRAASARSKPLSPERVPKPFIAIDEVLALPPSQRDQLLGIGEGLPGLEGRLVGCEPDSQWEVRVAEKEAHSLLVLAGQLGAAGMEWKVFVGSQERLSACPRWREFSLAPGELLAPEYMDEAVDGLGLVRLPDALRQGGVPVLAEGAELLRMLGEADRPEDCWVPVQGTREGWSSAVRVRALPGALASAHQALLEFVCRRKGELLRELEQAVEATWGELGSYWGAPGLPPPSREWLLGELWDRPGLRGVVCKARLRRDLVEPYEAGPEAA